jgi:Flp pilus assembly protein TadD
MGLSKGNAAFKVGDYPGAIGHYTAAILADRSDATFPLNRAAAYLKLGKYVLASFQVFFYYDRMRLIESFFFFCP